MSERTDALRAMLTDEWQSGEEIAEKMVAAGWWKYHWEALNNVNHYFNIDQKYGLCEKWSRGKPWPAYWRRKA